MNRKFSLLLSRIGARRFTMTNLVDQPGRAVRPNGFTLMELLIVMAIIAILMLIAIPTVGSLKKKANDLSAQQSVRAIHEAEIQYQSTYPSNGYACTLPALGGEPSSGAPSAAGAQILQGDLTSGFKSGYYYFLTNVFI